MSWDTGHVRLSVQIPDCSTSIEGVPREEQHQQLIRRPLCRQLLLLPAALPVACDIVLLDKMLVRVNGGNVPRLLRSGGAPRPARRWQGTLAPARPVSSLLRVDEEVAHALASGQPVVALESTIISHGLPYPQNLETAQAVEQAVRKNGAVPATTALIDGYLHVGLQAKDLEVIAESAIKKPAGSGPALNVVKASRRDLAQVIASGKGTIGGTTVSATMILAHMAGIDIFATGGIGGVHRGGETSMDVSADLTELGRTPVAVFCSGAKSILDIPRTLEYLETQGVSVSAFSRGSSLQSARTSDFPAFYTAKSGVSVPRVESEAHAAAVINASLQMGLTSGMVFGVPIPEQYEAAGLEIQKAVEQAVRESIEQGIDKRGKEVTPWLLARVKQLKSESVESNVALVVNNAEVAARTAKELSQLRRAIVNGGAGKQYHPSSISP